jgi:TRAP transporter TAXI family solute receptor
VLAMLLLACEPPDHEEYRVGTAALGGAYYPLGQGIANLVTQHAPGISMVPIVTRGAIENPRLIVRNDLELALTNADLAFFAYEGRPPYEVKLDVLAAGALHPSVLHLVTSASTGIVEFADLRGRQIAVGPAGGPTVALAETLLAAHGMTLDDVVPSFLSYSDGFSQLSDGNIDAAFALAGFPAAAVLQAGATDDLVFLRVPPDVLANVVTENPYYTLVQIPASVYATPEDVTALAVDNVLIVNAHARPDDVYAVVAAIYGHLPELGRAVAVARQIDPAHSLQLAIPLHPGARRYFDESLADARQ